MDDMACGSIYVYNKERSWKTYIQPGDPNHAELREKVVTLGVAGLKGYFYAVMDEDRSVRIFSDTILDPQDW